MEYALRDHSSKQSYNCRHGVLILILMEYALRVSKEIYQEGWLTGLNPYSNGIGSTRIMLYNVVSFVKQS